jgi:hypothetical protein
MSALIRTAAGELPNGSPSHCFFALSQGELFYPPGYRDDDHRLLHGINFTIGVLLLENGRWLARPTMGRSSYSIWATQYESRETALRAAVARVLRDCRARARPVRGDLPLGFRISHELAQEVITWALGLLGCPPQPLFRVTRRQAVIPERGQMDLFMGQEDRHGCN